MSTRSLRSRYFQPWLLHRLPRSTAGLTIFSQRHSPPFVCQSPGRLLPLSISHRMSHRLYSSKRRKRSKVLVKLAFLTDWADFFIAGHGGVLLRLVACATGAVIVGILYQDYDFRSGYLMWVKGWIVSAVWKVLGDGVRAKWEKKEAVMKNRWAARNDKVKNWWGRTKERRTPRWWRERRERREKKTDEEEEKKKEERMRRMRERAKDDD